MSTCAELTRSVLTIDPAAASRRIAAAIRDGVVTRMRRRGLIVGISGGIDSSVVAALAVRALGADSVIGLMMPEQESAPESTRLAQSLADGLGIRWVVEDVTATLAATGCYRRRDEAIQSVIPEYGDGSRCKLVLPDLVTADTYAIYSVVVRLASGEERRVRLPLTAYLQIVAATNFKQRVRKMMEYYYADRYRFAVAGTANRLEHDQGFFVKHGDGAADVKPIVHLYKSQVYQLAAWLGIPGEIQRRRPTTDTYSLDQSQEEFYFGLSLEQTDLCVYAKDHGIEPEAAAAAVGLSADQVERAYRIIASKRDAARYLHMPALLVDGDGGA